MAEHPDALDLVCSFLSRRVRPARPVPLSRWLAENLELVDGPAAGELWSAEGAPYLVEIADCLGDNHPCNLVTVRKSQQTGASILALGWVLYVAEREPANLLYGVPGLDALRDLNSGKLQPLIDAWQKRNGRTVIQPQTSRSGTGSTTYEKVFPGGRVWLANANTVMDLSSKTAKKGVKDELSKWQDIPGFGDPETLYFGRFTAFRRTKNYKILEISTPEIDSGADPEEAEGHCRIDRSFRKSDQRFFHIACPECGGLFYHRPEQFRPDFEQPSRSYYECDHCGHAVSESERVLALRSTGRWIATAEGPDRHPGFHIDAFISLMMSYEAIAEDARKSQKTEKARKDYHNLVLGLPYQYRGDAPDHVRLMERREEWLKRGHIPPRGLILVASADIQMRGIWVEIRAFASNGESFVIDAFYLDGETDSPRAPVFDSLRKEVLDREFPDAFGRKRKVDALGVDSGYRSHIVYAWVRAAQRLHPDTGRDVILALDGRDGWSHPAIGVPKLVDIDLDGARVKQGAKIWPVGTWPLKSQFYSNLRKDGIRSGAQEDPPGYCHFPLWLDENYFRQITAEHLEDVIVRGKIAGRKWAKTGENHFLDCVVYNYALADHLGLWTMTEDDWAFLAKRRGAPEAAPPDLFTHAGSVPAQETPSIPEPPDEPSGWLKAPSNWLRR
ncbi:MAG: phage terminase large subunit family protein [Proteobacteria bacterium]|nr:phage terminase large subunit family protein [Pseudomonadota bacterium]